MNYKTKLIISNVLLVLINLPLIIYYGVKEPEAKTFLYVVSGFIFIFYALASFYLYYKNINPEFARKMSVENLPWKYMFLTFLLAGLPMLLIGLYLYYSY